MTVTEMLKTMTADEVAAAKPTLSVKELYEDLRTHVERTSEVKIRKNILHGNYPFAVGYQEKTTQCEIYTKPYIKWLDEMFVLEKGA